MSKQGNVWPSCSSSSLWGPCFVLECSSGASIGLLAGIFRAARALAKTLRVGYRYADGCQRQSYHHSPEVECKDRVHLFDHQEQAQHL